MPKDMTIEELAEDIKTKHSEALDKVKEIAENAVGKAESGEELAKSAKEVADEAIVKMNELGAQLTDIEQKMSRDGSGQDDDQAKSWGQRFVEAEAVKGWLGEDPTKGKAELRTKATLTTATTDTDGAVGGGAGTQRLPGMITPPERQMFIRDLLTPGRMDEAVIEWIQETGFNNNADMVAEEALKPQSDIKLAPMTSTAKVIAHTMKVSRQALSDVSQLRSHIDTRLLYGLKLKEEAQILNGDGTGQNLNGIVSQATAYAAPGSLTAATAIDTMRIAILQAALAEYPATAHVMNPIDWARIELEKDGDGRYIIGQPQGNAPASLWKLPVVATQAITVDKFLTGAFQMGAQLWDRWDARVEAGFENDDFTRNLITLLAEERLALTVYRPEAFIYGDLGYVS